VHDAGSGVVQCAVDMWRAVMIRFLEATYSFGNGGGLYGFPHPMGLFEGAISVS